MERLGFLQGRGRRSDRRWRPARLPCCPSCQSASTAGKTEHEPGSTHARNDRLRDPRRRRRPTSPSTRRTGRRRSTATTRTASRSSRASRPCASGPGMYIGDTDDGTGLHHMVYEVVDNSVDEALAGFCDRIDVDHPPRRLGLGRGQRPRHPGRRAPHREAAHRRGRHDRAARRRQVQPLELQGLGRSARRRRLGGQRAVATWLKLEIKRDGKIWYQEYRRGDPVTGLDAIGVTDKTGTKVTFHPDPEIFKGTEFSFDILSQRLRELAYLNQRPHHHPRGRAHAARRTSSTSRAASPSSSPICRPPRPVIHDKPVVIEGEVDGTEVEIAMQWNDSYQETIFCFTNNIKNKDGGTHLTGFRAALTRTVNAYAQAQQPAQGSEDRPGRRRHQRGPDRRRLGQAPRPQVQQPAQGQAGLVRGQGHRRARRQRAPRPLPRGAPARGQADHREGGAGGAGARGGPQGARAGAAQGRARLLVAAGQAGRLPGARPGAVRALHRRGRQRRWLGQAGPQPQGSGDPAAARQDPQRREGAPRQDALLTGDRHADHRARLRRREGKGDRQGPLPPRSSS